MAKSGKMTKAARKAVAREKILPAIERLIAKLEAFSARVADYEAKHPEQKDLNRFLWEMEGKEQERLCGALIIDRHGILSDEKYAEINDATMPEDYACPCDAMAIDRFRKPCREAHFRLTMMAEAFRKAV